MIAFRYLISFLMIFLCMLSSRANADIINRAANEDNRPYVIVVQPSDDVNDALWYEVVDRHLKYAAKDLNMKVENFFAGDDRTKVTSNVMAKIKSGDKPDYLVFSNQVGIGVNLLMLCETIEIKCFIYGSSLSQDDIEKYGGPGESFKNWIGQIIPDDEDAGFNLAKILIEQARKTKEDNNDNTPIRVIGITGTSSTPASVNRTNGLRRAVSSYPDVEILQIVSARWVRRVAADKYDLLTSRYGGADVVWAASNDMALAVLERARSLGHIPKIGGFDFVPPAVDALKEAGLSAAVGGHEIDIAYVMKLLRAYHDGDDFMAQTGTASLRSKLIPLTPDSVSEYSIFFDKLTRGDVNYKTGLDGFLQDKAAQSNISMQAFRARLSVTESTGD
jgi:ABC-type sugar transport system substrate-binding protein